MSWIEALSSVVRAIAIPYGYTLAIWAAGMLTISRYGHPQPRDVFTFVLGAVIGYLLFDIASIQTSLNGEAGLDVNVPSAALLNMLPIIPALLSALVAREVPSRVLGFPVMGFAATSFYILSLASLFWAWDKWS